MTDQVQLLGVSNAIVDVLAHVDYEFLDRIDAIPGSMTLIDKERARRLIRAGVNSVSVSLDDPDGKLHDQVRGRPGAFRMAW